MTKQMFLGLVSLIPAALLGEGAKPNIIFIMADDRNETTDLSSKNPARISRLMGLLESWEKDVTVELPISQ